MPMYDYECPKCEGIHTKIMSYEEYDESDELECKHCGGTVDKSNRIIGSNIQKIVKGVSKGNFNSRDFS
jgi:putative FmdB family regulatory protein